MTLRTPCSALAVWALAPLSLLCLAAAPAVAQDQVWLRQFGTNAIDHAWALAPDGEGGMMVAGLTDGSLGGPNAGERDAFLAHYDDAGVQTWIRQWGTSSVDEALGLASDGAGGVYVTGTTFGALGGFHAGEDDAFVAHYDAAGEQLWIRQFGTSSGDEILGVAIDGLGGVFVSGWTEGSLGGANAGERDAFLAHYTEKGIQTWIEQWGTSSREEAVALAPDGAGGVMIAGFTGGSLAGANAGLMDVFLARYDASGKQTWIQQFGTSGDDWALALATDDAGGAMITGFSDGSLGGPNMGIEDVFLARYNAAGIQTWIRQIGTAGFDIAWGLAADGSGGVCIAGWTEGGLAGPNAGESDVFLAQYDDAGDQLWISQFGTNTFDEAWALAPDGEGGVVVAGLTDGNLSGPNAGFSDVFLARYSLAEPCLADCDGSGAVNTLDFLCFLNLFSASDPDADCDGSGGINTLDFLCFLNAFNDGCP